MFALITGFMHGRTVGGKPEIFGNAGGLFMSAMTWWDHSTKTIWSQPWGRAIDGSLKGTELDLLPSQVTTWANWREEHPETLVMINDVDRFRLGPEVFYDDFVIGLVLEDAAKAYAYLDVAATGVVNDMMGVYPVLVWVNNDNYHAYMRNVDGRVLTFRWENDQLIDEETGSVWDVMRGRAMQEHWKDKTCNPSHHCHPTIGLGEIFILIQRSTHRRQMLVMD